MLYQLSAQTTPEEWERLRASLRKQQLRKQGFQFSTQGKDYLPEITDPVAFQKQLGQQAVQQTCEGKTIL
jgi:hypothetical protein